MVMSMLTKNVSSRYTKYHKTLTRLTSDRAIEQELLCSMQNGVCSNTNPLRILYVVWGIQQHEEPECIVTILSLSLRHLQTIPKALFEWAPRTTKRMQARSLIDMVVVWLLPLPCWHVPNFHIGKEVVESEELSITHLPRHRHAANSCSPVHHLWCVKLSVSAYKENKCNV